MFSALLAALKAVPLIVDALNRLADVGTAIAAQNRKDDKDEMVDDLIARAISKRVHKDEIERVDESGGGESDGL